MIQEIGSMVSQLRKKLAVSQEKLGRGLISDSELSRIEHGEKEGDSFLMTALFQRLGKSMDQFEMTVSNDEYQLILLRAFIQESMESGDYDRTVELLEEYEDSMEKDKKLHIQYVGLIRTMLRYLKGEDKKECLECLKEAMALTFSDEGRSDWSCYCFCIQEVHLLLLIAYLELETGETRKALEMLRKLHDCIDVAYTSEVSKVQVYPKCCYLLSKAYLEAGEKDEAYEIAEKGIQNLIKTRYLTFMEDLLGIQQKCRFDKEREAQIQAIRFAYELAEYKMSDAFVVRLLFSGICEEVTLNNELLLEMRAAQGMTQEQASDGICARETYARIENGSTASRRNLQEILRRLKVERERYFGYVITEDWDAYELVWNYKRNCFEENQEDALEILEEIETRIDMSRPENKQFVETARLRDRIRKREIGWDEAIEKLTELLRYTMPEYKGKLFRIPSREEFIILNRIALSLKLAGRKDEAIALYEEILQKYQASKVRPEHHTHVMMLLYLNYFAALYSKGDIAEAKKIAYIGIKLMLKYGRGDFLALFIANIACAYEESQTQAELMLAFPCLASSYHVLKFFELEKQCENVRKHIEKKYTDQPFLFRP